MLPSGKTCYRRQFDGTCNYFVTTVHERDKVRIAPCLMASTALENNCHRQFHRRRHFADRIDDKSVYSESDRRPKRSWFDKPPLEGLPMRLAPATANSYIRRAKGAVPLGFDSRCEFDRRSILHCYTYSKDVGSSAGYVKSSSCFLER